MIPSTRGRIMEATLRLVAQRGFDGVAVTDIEADVGLSPGSGSFYRHFRGKEEALQAAVEHEVKRIAESRDRAESAAAGDSVDDRARLSRRLRHSLATLRELRPLIAILARERKRLPELVRKVQSAMVDSGLEEVRDEVKRLSTAAGHGDSLAIAAVVLNATVGHHLAADFFGTPPGGIDDERFADALADLVCGTAPMNATVRTKKAAARRRRPAQRIGRSKTS